MKRIFCIILVIISAIISFSGCNNASNNVESDNFSTQSIDTIPISTEKQTQVIYSGPPMKRSVSVDSLEELSQLRELMSCTDQQELESSMLKFGILNINDLSNFLAMVDSVPYLNVMDGNITWIAYDEYEENIEYTVLYVTVTAENGDSVRITYRPKLVNPTSWAHMRAKQESSSLITNPLKSEDKRITLFSEVKEKHPVYPGQYVEWIGLVDGIGVEILYYAANISGINSNSLLSSLTISSLAPNDTVDPTLIEQITEGMTYKEVTEILGTTGTQVGSGAIIFEYHLSDGKTARIWLQTDGSNDLNNYCVEGIRIE